MHICILLYSFSIHRYRAQDIEVLDPQQQAEMEEAARPRRGDDCSHGLMTNLTLFQVPFLIIT